jgi:hypothetical protein
MSIRSLSCTAARQLLQYSIFNNQIDLHDQYFSALNGLNGNGYPHLTRNIGVSFTPAGLQQNPYLNQRWARIVIEDRFTGGALYYHDENFNVAADPVAEAGSLLPRDNLVNRSGNVDPDDIDEWWEGFVPEWALRWILYFYPDDARPTFIPRSSALDLDENGNSRFDFTIQPAGMEAYGHDEFPTEPTFMLAILNALEIPLPDQMIAGIYDGCDRHTILAQHTLTNLDASGAPQAVLFQVTGGCTPEPSQLGAGRTVRLAAGPAAEVRFVAGVEARIYADPVLDSGDGIARDPASVGRRGDLVLAGAKPSVESVKTGDGAPALRTALLQNTPNPFNPSTRIDFTLAQPGPALIQVFDLKGSVVATLLDGIRRAGLHSVEWRGLDDQGRRLNSGVYFYRLVAPGYTSVKKMIMIK